MPMSPRLLRPRAAGGFDPRSITGISGWYSATKSSLFQNTDGTTAATATNDPVGYVSDLSGNDRHLRTVAANGTQVNASRPQLSVSARNGRNALVFDGSNDYLTHNSLPTGGTNIHVFVVTNWTTGGVIHAILDNNHCPGFVMQSVFGPVGYGSCAGGDVSSLVSNGQWRLLSGHSSATTNSMRTNGANLVTANTTSTPTFQSRLMIGSAWNNGSVYRPATASVSEMLIYHAALSASEIDAISTYLMREYAI